MFQKEDVFLTNETKFKVDPRIAREYAKIALTEFDSVQNQSKFSTYTTNPCFVHVVKADGSKEVAYVFVFFPKNGETELEPNKKRQYGLIVLSFYKDGYMYPNLRGYPDDSRDDIINDFRSMGNLGPDF